jgi:PmbA protein
MSKKILNQVKDVIKEAQKLGADQVRASISRNRDSEVEWLDDRLERVRESTTMGLSVDLYVDGRYSSHNTSDLRPDAISAFLEEGVAATRLLAQDEHRKLPDPDRYADIFAGDLKSYDPKGSASVTGTDRRRLAQAVVEGSYNAPGGDKIISAKSSCSDGMNETAMATSNGLEVSEISTQFVLWVQTTVKDEGDRKPRSFWFDAALFRDELGAPDKIGAKATELALLEIGQKPIETGSYNCIIENRQVGRILGGLLGALNGNTIQQDRSFLASKKNEQIASPLFSIVDEPHIPGGFGSSLVDGEGMATRTMPIIENGVLRNFFLNTYYASKLGVEPTTGSSTNMVFSTGDKDLETLMRKMGDGLLLTGFSGGNSNSASGDFSIGITGHQIKGGKRVQPISEMNLSGNHSQIWNQVVEMGGDPYLKSSRRVPSILFEGLTFSGV